MIDEIEEALFAIRRYAAGHPMSRELRELDRLAERALDVRAQEKGWRSGKV